MGIALIAIIVILITYWSYHVLDNEMYRYHIEHLVKKYTGHELKIQGAFGIELGWYPQLTMKDVRLSNATWGMPPANMFEAKQVSMKIVLHSLMRRKLVTKNIEIDGANFLMQKNAAEQWNWPILQKSTATDPRVLQTFPRMTIKNSNLLYHSLLTGQEEHWFFDWLTIDFSRGKDQVAIDLQGRHETLPVRGNGVISLDPKLGFPVHAEADVAGNQLVLDGTLQPPAHFHMTLSGSNPTVAAAWFGADVPANTPYQVKADVTVTGGRYQLSNFQLSLNPQAAMSHLNHQHCHSLWHHTLEAILHS
jgi:uncharacterized protein involved in outer membrane biogenesis